MISLNKPTEDFARQHADDDVRQLALRGTKDTDVDLTLALQQIQGRQTARRKLPTWANCEGIVYPPHLNMEQCSSEQTARYKLATVNRLIKEYIHPSCGGAGGGCSFGGVGGGSSFGGAGGGWAGGGSSFIDLTGGFGVDFTVMASAFDEAAYNERDPQLCAVAQHNFGLLTEKTHKTQFLAADATELLQRISHVTLIFLDPARRDSHGGRTYALADCTPDVLQLRDLLLEKADFVMLKLSPMLDWRKAVADLGQEHVSEVHIVSVGGECKELLVVMSRQANSLTLYCVNDNDSWMVQPSMPHEYREIHSPSAPAFLYEPNASVMKAGCWEELSAAFGVSQIAPNSHLFLADKPVEGFPGRCFHIETVATMNKRDLRQALQGVSQANITTRNFPLTPPQLRQRLKIKDGGENYVFATTDADNRHILFVCHPVRSATRASSSGASARKA